MHLSWQLAAPSGSAFSSRHSQSLYLVVMLLVLCPSSRSISGNSQQQHQQLAWPHKQSVSLLTLASSGAATATDLLLLLLLLLLRGTLALPHQRLVLLVVCPVLMLGSSRSLV
jgi:hypothetical protein